MVDRSAGPPPSRPGSSRRASGAVVRRLLTLSDECLFVRGKVIAPVRRRAAAVAIVSNPNAGRYQEDLKVFALLGGRLAKVLGERAIERVGGPGAVAAYGKAALIGLDGELEHGAAVLHPRLGAVLRSMLGGATSMMPSVSKLGPAGAVVDIPLHHVSDQWSLAHFDTLSVAIPDAPGPDEILVAIAVSDGGRPLARAPAV